MNVILCGLPASGKTTISKLLARQLQWTFVDTDRLIEKNYEIQTGKYLDCSQIFSQEGEKIFRELEHKALLSLKGCKELAVAIGGGALLDPKNRLLLQFIGVSFYLKTAMTTLWQRIRKRGLPAYLDRINPHLAFYKMAKKRLAFYENAHYTIETEQLNAEEICHIIHSALFLESRHGGNLTEKQSV